MLSLPYGSLPHNGLPGDLPVSRSSLYMAPAKQPEQQHVSLHPWQVLVGSAAAASKRVASSPTLSGCRTVATTVTAAARASAAKPPGCKENWPSTGTGATSSSSSSPDQACPLHACLLQHGITDLAAFSAPRHLALSQEAVSSNVEPKLAALAAEGLSPKQVARIFADKTNSPLACIYSATFQPNLQLLREVAAHMKYTPHPKTAQLTAVGKVLAASPAAIARCLSRNPSKVQQLLQCLEGELGIGLEQLAACSSLYNFLDISASSAHAAVAVLLEKGVPVQQVACMALTAPYLLRLSATTLAAKLAALEEVLDLDAEAALQLALGQPGLLAYDIKARLPPLLRFLNEYMEEEGAGRRLVLAQPTLGTSTAAAVERKIGSLAARGYSQQDIQSKVNKQHVILTLDLDSPVFQQKLDWIERVSPWTLDDFLDVPRYLLASTHRLAARLALFQYCELQPPSTPAVLVIYSNSKFMAFVRKQLEKQGRELPWASWAEWEEAWLGTEEGREWGFPPLKD